VTINANSTVLALGWAHPFVSFVAFCSKSFHTILFEQKEMKGTKKLKIHPFVSFVVFWFARLSLSDLVS
jgi:hypothetical protein